MLKTLVIELTERCNNDCIHCSINLPSNDHRAQKKESSTNKIKRYLKEAVSLGCLTVRFTGGEPLLRKDFKDLYIYARKLGLRVEIFTNATLINSELSELFSYIPPLGKVEVTLYGMRKESYESVTRNKNSYIRAMKGINRLLFKNVPFIIKATFLPFDMNELKTLESYTSSIPWMNNNISLNLILDLRSRRDSKEKNKIIKSLRIPPNEVVKILSRDKKKFLSSFVKLKYLFRPPGSLLFSCGAGIESASIDAYGFCQPCLLLRNPKYTFDLNKGTLKDALFDFFPKLRLLKAKNSTYNSQCANCFLYNFCENCPAKSWIEHGILDSKVDYYCEITHKVAQQIGLLNKGEKSWEIRDWEKRVNRFIMLNEKETVLQ
ncbi:MAG: radical SAM protein [Promethearchaeati archaeon]